MREDYTRGIVFVCLFFGSQFRLVNYFDSEIVRSLSAYFGKTRSEIGYSQVADLFGKVIVKRKNIKLFDLLARFHYILNSNTF